MSGPYQYNPQDLGADGIRATENWRGSGYTHYTAWNHTHSANTLQGVLTPNEQNCTLGGLR
jgi:hypothetical protein